MKVLNENLYEYVKHLADRVYDKPSAYKSGFIVKKYKEFGGKFADDHKEKPLQRWYREKWMDVGHKDYPVYRPTKRINRHTPLTVQEVDPHNLSQQIKRKQKIKGEYNLSPFKRLYSSGS
jgi:hypothetical protein